MSIPELLSSPARGSTAATSHQDSFGRCARRPAAADQCIDEHRGDRVGRTDSLLKAADEHKLLAAATRKSAARRNPGFPEGMQGGRAGSRQGLRPAAPTDPDVPN